MSNGTPLGGCSAIVHLFASYPKVAACIAVLGLGAGTAVLTRDQLEQCDKVVAQCQSVTLPPVKPVPPTPSESDPPKATATAVTLSPLPQAVSLDMCPGAPTITDADIFKVTGPVNVWRQAGVDPVRGKPTEPFLRTLGYTEHERAVFMEKISLGDSVQRLLKKGDFVGRSMSGNGTYHNSIIGWTPVKNTGTNYKNDARMNVYMYTYKARYNGACVERTVFLYEPLVCQNWSRPNDVIRGM